MSDRKSVKCERCNGTGREDEGCGYNGICRDCRGKGTVSVPVADTDKGEANND